MPRVKVIIFDWGSTLYDRASNSLFPDVKSVLDKLSGKYQLAIVALATDGDVESRMKVIRNEDLESFFDLILFDQSDKDSLYEKAVNHFQVKPSEVAIVDDRVVRGVKWGNQNGALTFWIRRGKFVNEKPTEETETPSCVVNSLEEVTKYLSSQILVNRV